LSPEERDQRFRAWVKDLKSQDTTAFIKAAFALAVSKDARAYRPLLELLGHKSPDRAFFAMISLGELGDLRAVIPLMGSMTTAALPTLRHTAARALKRLDARTAGEKLRDHLKSGRIRPLDRLRLGPPLGVLGAEAALEALDVLARDSQYEVRQGAVTGYGHLTGEGDLRGVDRLIAMLRDRSREVRTVAHLELLRLTGRKLPLDQVRWQDWWAAQGRKLPARSPSDELDTANPPRPERLDLGGKEIDIIFVFDATGSLGRKWPTVNTPVLNLILNIVSRKARLRVGTVEYRAEHTALAVKRRPLSYDTQAAYKHITRIKFGGRSGALREGLLAAVRDFQWREGAYRAILIVGDLGPRPVDLAGTLRLARAIRAMEGIPVSAVFIESAHGPAGRGDFARIAAEGGGRFYEYDHAENVLRDHTPGAPKAPKRGEPTTRLADKLLTITPRPAKKP
jgi:hypothetical protein